jgi:hypothetical protein
MPNVFSFSNWVAPKALQLLVNKLHIAQKFDTEWMKQFQQSFAVGSSVQVKLPQKWTVRTGLAYQPQGINRITTTVNCNLIKGIDFQWDDVEKALEMERSNAEISKQYLEPAMAQLAQQIDSDAADFAYKNANNIVGVLGVDPTNSTTFMQAQQTLYELACPAGGDRGVCLTPSVATAVVPGIQTYFNPAPEISRAFKEGALGMFNGFEWLTSMSIKRHTAGTWAGAVTLDATSLTSGNTIIVACTTGDTFNEGDVFSIANVNYVNPMTREAPNTKLKQFVVRQATVGAASLATLLISPAIFGPGSQYQNVDALPVSGAALTLFPGTVSPNGVSGAQNLALHPDAFALVNVKLESPEAVEVISQARDPKTGIAIRFVRVWDGRTSEMINRWDMVYGFGAMYPDNCCVRVLGA